MIRGKNILLGISGSIAAFKAPLLVRLLKKEGANVKVVMTPSAVDFVTPLTLSTLSQQPVLLEPYNKVDGSWHSHVEWGRWADLFVIAPASANTLGKMANGIADNLLTTCYLSAKCPVFFAPAMDLDMFKHPTTSKNIRILQSFGNKVIEPQTGELASGLTGAGRMEEPEVILQIIKDYFNKKNELEGKKVLISAGPTFEAIDPVRYIGNHSSGLMGYALAEEAVKRGASVTLVSGPVNISIVEPSMEIIKVTSAAEMMTACINAASDSNIIIMAAAVADYTPEEPSKEKIKKTDTLGLKLKQTGDILASLGKNKVDGQYLAGFALETENEKENALKKLHNKNLDMIVLNSLNDKGAGFGTDTNKVTMLFPDKSEVITDTLSKTVIAEMIIDEIVKRSSGL
ncbi:MAG TPA: bifunctional phosphopantothenoylcysteine decarboxylase/phosphopantothenate--cysteine ligase CoaBC [Lentimicrobium sp.]|nr:bifunctional phosphopantothenoylcysteine decarboxylase/phosphopantothenate--cysteine ligase CoaBC [Lentimicrobium sp.]